MSRNHGRTPRNYRLRVRTVRRDPIDAGALAQAALEHAAMQHRGDPETSARDKQAPCPPQITNEPKEPRDDELA